MIKRKWAFVLSIFFTIFSISKFFSGTITNSTDPLMYNLGSTLSAVLFPIVFFVIAFLSKKEE